MTKDKNLQIDNFVEFEFYKNYAEKITPILDKFEKERISTLKELIPVPAVMFLISVILFVVPLCTFVDFMEPDTVLYYLCFIVFALSLFIGGIYVIKCCNDDFRENIKRKTIKNILKTFGNITRKRNLINIAELQISELFGSDINYQEIDDSFAGMYNGVEFFIIETKIANDRKDCGFDFKGIILVFDCSKKIKNKTLVVQKRYFYCSEKTLVLIDKIISVMVSVFLILLGLFFCVSGGDIIGYILGLGLLVMGILSSLLIVFRPKSITRETLIKMPLEDPEFERKYNAYSSDQIEGRYLLTTAFMERFKNLHTAFGSKRAKCSFYNGNKLMIAIPTNKNLFEIGNLFSPVNNTRHINTFLKEIQAVYKMIDYFKLDQHTGL